MILILLINMIQSVYIMFQCVEHQRKPLWLKPKEKIRSMQTYRNDLSFIPFNSKQVELADEPPVPSSTHWILLASQLSLVTPWKLNDCSNSVPRPSFAGTPPQSPSDHKL